MIREDWYINYLTYKQSLTTYFQKFKYQTIIKFKLTTYLVLLNNLHLQIF